MTDREKIEEILREGLFGKSESAYLADYLISKGVTIPVRCKECKYFTLGTFKEITAAGMCKRIPDKPIIPMVYNNYCVFGERREK